MNNRLTFFEPTNFTLPIAVFNTLVDDAYYFGFIKNNQANLSGLLNHLIPNLSMHRQDFHLTLLCENDNDEKLTHKIEENIYKHYFNKYDYCDDGTCIVPFRVNKEHMQEFLDIVDKFIHVINMDFSSYVRSLLVEYCSKRLNQREYFFFYKEISKMKNAIENSVVCHFYTEDEKIAFTPISIEPSRNNEQNLIVGYDTNNQNAYVLPLSFVKRIVFTEISCDLTENDIEFAYACLENYEKEKELDEKCLD